MKKAYLITGTDTGIGKSVITAGIAVYLQSRGINVGVFKPLQSGAKKKNGRYYSEDAFLAALALGMPEKTDEFGPFCFPGEKAPYYAMQENNSLIDLSQLEEKYCLLKKQYDFLLLEGAGGICVPYLSEDFLVADLAKKWELPVIIVARGTLGTINHVLLTANFLRQMDLPIAGFILNWVENEQREEAVLNAQAIERMGKVKCLGIVPVIKDLKPEEGKTGNLLAVIKKYCDLTCLEEDF